MTDYELDLFVIGAGSGGVRAARMAAALGVKVAIAENWHLGGTCVNVGCVPKKLFVYAAQFSEEFAASKGFGWRLGDSHFDWKQLLAQKNHEISRLQTVYGGLLEHSGVQLVWGHAQILDAHRVAVGEKVFSCRHILVASGGQPAIPDIPGKEWVVSSNEMFTLENLPTSILIVGGGYIAVEFAGIMNGLGVKTTLCYRGDKLLRGFDEDIRDFAAQEIQKKGIDIRLNTQISQIEKTAAGYAALTEQQEIINADLVLYATGRKPNTSGLGLEKLGVELDEGGRIKTNRRFQTNVPSIFALGDVANQHNLTPVATTEAMIFVKQNFSNQAVEMDYDNIPTAVFCQPNIGTVGLSETAARKRFPAIDIYKSVFTPMKHALSGLDEKTLMKLVVNRDNDQVLGVHMVGADAGEIIQGMAIAIRAGATKAIFDSTIGVHPTAAEELVTMRKPVM